MRRSTTCIADRTVHCKLEHLVDGTAAYQVVASISHRSVLFAAHHESQLCHI